MFDVLWVECDYKEQVNQQSSEGNDRINDQNDSIGEPKFRFF